MERSYPVCSGTPDEWLTEARTKAAENVAYHRREWEKAHDLYQQLGDVQATAQLIECAGTDLAL